MDCSPVCSPNCSPNVKTLAIAAFLFAVITLAQFFAAIAANSAALLADCVSMVPRHRLLSSQWPCQTGWDACIGDRRDLVRPLHAH